MKNVDIQTPEKSDENPSPTYSQSAANIENQTQNGNTSGKDENSSSLKYSPMGCPDCVVLFPTQDLMMQHFSRPPHRLMCNLNVNKCPVLTCDVSFATKSKLLEHLVAGKHGQPCPQCGKDFPKVSITSVDTKSDIIGHWNYVETKIICCQSLNISMFYSWINWNYISEVIQQIAPFNAHNVSKRIKMRPL